MIGAVLCVLAAALVLWAGRRSLGDAVGALMAVGYSYGILRANFEDGVSHFIFDAALIALYVVAWRRRREFRLASGVKQATGWLKALVVMCVAAMVLSLASEPQHPFIQLVGFRAATLMLPMMIVGAALTPEAFDRIAGWFVVLNMIALGFAVAEMSLGIEKFFPENASTQIMYMSNDVEGGFHRIPATFLNAHSYGGTMAFTIPFVFAWAIARRGFLRVLGILGLLAALLGVFICAARQPVVQLALALGTSLMVTRPSLRTLAALFLAALVVGAIVMQTPRLQRFMTLEDADRVTNRVSGSVNAGFFDMVLEYPLGRGLGSAVGTSIPFFLQEYAQPQIGMENEYGRIALEQGVLGLGLWILFALSVVRRFPSAGRVPGETFAVRLRWAQVVTVFATASIGTGMLTAVPGSAMLLLVVGDMFAQRSSAPQTIRGRPNALATIAES